MTTRTAYPCEASHLTAGPIVLGAAVAGGLGYALAVWFAHMATYAELLEERQYCGADENVTRAGTTAHARAATGRLLPVPG